MTQKRWAYFALGAVTGIGIGAVTNVVAQSVYPVRFDDSQPAVSYAAEGETPDGTPSASAPGSGAEALTVEGEVRTVDASGAARVWGQGRPGAIVNSREGFLGRFCSNGTVKFGLSQHTTHWGSSAAVCPAGTWVCTVNERGTTACDTVRGDSLADAFNCAGNPDDFPANDHIGWLADTDTSPAKSPVAAVSRESALQTFWPSCWQLPVWCCFET